MTCYRLLPIALVIIGSIAGLVSADLIEGYVINPADEGRVANVEIAFSVADQDGAFSEMMRKSSDADGRFSFSGPFLSDGLPYTLTAYYRDISYPTATLVVGAQRQVILEVFDSTAEPAGVHISAHHVFLSVGADLLEVAQLLQVHNSGEATFIGSNADANRVTRVRVPDGAFNFRGAGQEQGDQVFVGEGDSFFHTQPIVPGRSQIAFTFQVALSEFSGTFEHFAPFDTESLEFYLQPASIELDDPFRDLGPVTLHDQTYRRYHIDGLPRSGTIDVVLPVSGSIRWALKWVSLGLMLFASVAAFGLSGRAGAEAHHATTAVGSLADTAGIDPGADSQELEQLRGNLLERLAHMDTAGHHPEHGETRKQLTDRAVAVYQLLALKRGGA